VVYPPGTITVPLAALGLVTTAYVTAAGITGTKPLLSLITTVLDAEEDITGPKSAPSQVTYN
jgi:hypothetical protein